MWNWLNTNAGVLSLILALVLTLGPLLFAGLRYIRLRSDELRFKKFEIYHNLIRQLVQSESPSGIMYVDRQIAIVFELRNFPEYYELSIRLLFGLKDSWADKAGFNHRLLEEMNNSMAFMNKRLKPRKRIELGTNPAHTEGKPKAESGVLKKVRLKNNRKL